jgi:hypothetical protein
VMEGYWDPNGTEDNPDDDFWIEGDYRLLSASPCIDAGDPNYVTYVDDLDMDGFMRVMDGHCDGVSRLDMGAYEAPVPIDVQITPEVIYFESKGNFVFAHLQLPAVLQINEEDLEKVLLDGAVEALEIEWGQDDGMLTVKFDRAEVNAYLAETGALGQVQLGVEVVLVDRMRLWGVDTVTFLKGT